MTRMTDPSQSWMTGLQEHRSALLAYAQRQLAGTGLDPDDFVQDALERSLRVFVDRPPPASTEAWLRKVLHNLLVTDFRRRLVRQRAELDLTLSIGPPAPLDGEP